MTTPKLTGLVEKDDIFLLLESYKNNIELSSTLLEQQRQLLTKQEELIKKQDSACDDLKEVLKKSDQCAINSLNIQAKVLESQTLIKTDMLKDNNKIHTNMYIQLGCLFTIIISLIGLLITLFEKFSYIKAIAVKIGAVIV